MTSEGFAYGRPAGRVRGDHEAEVHAYLAGQFRRVPQGPRLGDLSVQTSSYGTQIPRIYGSMRVAGSVVWATDLVEGEQTTGAKGQPDVTYSYSVSLAVALSSRLVGSIRRIWADGKLLRGAEGDFKVPTTFRFYNGSENQEIDPLIGSVEGLANTPAYRGLALAVFEKLELAAFGNRIPFMTFEVIADDAPPGIGSILADASAGAIAADATETITGYAAYGRSVAEAVQPLVDCFDVPLFDDGETLRSPLDLAPVVVGADELGSSADGQRASRVQREQLPVRAVPSTLRLTYYDPARDYQTGEARARAGDEAPNEVQQQLPAVVSADDAKALVQRMLARQWTGRDRVTLRLPPARIGLEPGSIVEPGLAPAAWTVDKCTIEGFVTTVELRPAWKPTVELVGEPGRIVPISDIVEAPSVFGLVDAVSPLQAPAPGPMVLIAGSSESSGWTTKLLSLAASGQTFATQTAARKSVLGRALTVLSDSGSYLIDEINSVDVQLIDPEQWLTSCDDHALAEGVNLATIGSELIQFAQAIPLGTGRFRLARLLRGRGGTDWATASHATDETFCLLDSNSLMPLDLPVWTRGSVLTVTDASGSSASVAFEAECVRPLSPVDLHADSEASGALVLSWTRRSRAGFAWVDEVDAPLGETQEQYRVIITGTAGSFELIAEQPTLTVAAADIAWVGSGAAVIQVRQLGDWAASRPAEITIALP